MDVKQETLRWLDQRKIPYQRFAHEAAHTIDDCLKMPFQTSDVTMCKNVFLCNRQQTQFFLMLLCPHTPFRTAAVSKALGVSRLSFAPDEKLSELLSLSSGSVSPLGLLYDRDRRVTLCYEPAVRNTPKIGFHPCDSTETLIFEQTTFWNRVLPEMKVVPIAVDIAISAV